jgi:hypothetical protein
MINGMMLAIMLGDALQTNLGAGAGREGGVRGVQARGQWKTSWDRGCSSRMLQMRIRFDKPCQASALLRGCNLTRGDVYACDCLAGGKA